MKGNEADIFYCTSNLYGLYRAIAEFGLANRQVYKGFDSVKTHSPWPNFIYNARSENDYPAFDTDEITLGVADGSLPPWWISGPMDDVLPYSAKLREIGFRPVALWPAMVFDLSKLNQQYLTYHAFNKIFDPMLLNEWWNLVSVNLFEGKKFPQDFCELVRDYTFNFFAMCDGETMVATCMTYLYGDVAGIYMVTVDKAYRNQGVASSMISQVLAILESKNIRKAYLQANKVSFSLYKQLGFNYLCDYTLFWNPGGKQ